MAITQITVSFPTIATPPTRSDPASWNTRSDTFLPQIATLGNTTLPTFRTQLNTMAGEMDTVAAAVDTDASAAGAARDLSQTYRNQAEDYRNGAQLYASQANTARNSAQTAQGAAEQAATDAEGYASQAQATNPDTPIRINPNVISNDFTLANGYNGHSAGPIEIQVAATVAITHGSTWAIA